MNSSSTAKLTEELLTLASYWCEGELLQPQHQRLQDLLRGDDQLRSLFVRYIQLHGQLAWDCAGAPLPATGPDEEWDDNPEAWQSAALACCSDPDLDLDFPSRRPRHSLRTFRLPAAIAGLALVLLWCTTRLLSPAPQPATVARSAPDSAAPAPATPDSSASPSPETNPNHPPLVPLRLPALVAESAPQENTSAAVASPPQPPAPPSNVPGGVLDDSAVIAQINQQLRQAWQDNSVTPAPVADDYEWVRRTYLTIAGRIPTQQEVSSYASSTASDKRSALVDSLLRDTAFSANLAATWTNLLIGRSNPRRVNQQALYSFLLEQFSQNRPWIDTVGRLISAEGRSDQQGETNFLLAHLNDQATPATAVTARLFLGQQVHCMQCHDHPLAQQLKQSDFWSLNAFFKNAVSRPLAEQPPGAAQPVLTLHDSASAAATSSTGGMTFYENRRGEQKAVLPEFSGRTIPADTSARRSELASILADEQGLHVARSMVNRTWAMFFGYGFTNPIDDLGPHNPPSNPELLDGLTLAFANSGYDLQRLMRWIALSEAFSLSSLPPDSTEPPADDPEEGGIPLFSRIYSRPMGPEQVYESLRTAIHSVSGKPLESDSTSDHRRQWVQQFVQFNGTDDNAETVLFESNISQALLLMNGADLESAIPLAAAELAQSLRDPNGLSESLNRIALATLNRQPTEREERAFRNRYRTLSRSLPPLAAIQTTAEDMLWAYLNSSEFSSVH